MGAQHAVSYTHLEINQAPRTLESTKAAIKLFNAEFGYMTLESLNPLFLQHYINTMLHTPKSSGKTDTLSQGTVKRRAAVLSAMLSQAVRWNLIESNPDVYKRQPICRCRRSGILDCKPY